MITILVFVLLQGVRPNRPWIRPSTVAVMAIVTVTIIVFVIVIFVIVIVIVIVHKLLLLLFYIVIVIMILYYSNNNLLLGNSFTKSGFQKGSKFFFYLLSIYDLVMHMHDLLRHAIAIRYDFFSIAGKSRAVLVCYRSRSRGSY